MILQPVRRWRGRPRSKLIGGSWFGRLHGPVVMSPRCGGMRRKMRSNSSSAASKSSSVRGSIEAPQNAGRQAQVAIIATTSIKAATVARSSTNHLSMAILHIAQGHGARILETEDRQVQCSERPADHEGGEQVISHGRASSQARELHPFELSCRQSRATIWLILG
jgi:hypothetical protein